MNVSVCLHFKKQYQICFGLPYLNSSTKTKPSSVIITQNCLRIYPVPLLSTTHQIQLFTQQALTQNDKSYPLPAAEVTDDDDDVASDIV